MVSFLLTIISVNSFAQEEYPIFNEYRNYGFYATPILFKKAEISRKYGDRIFGTRSNYAVQFGIKKHFNKEKEWSIITGVNFTPLPFYKFSFELKNEDMPHNDYNESLFVSDSSIGSFYASFISQAEHKIQLSKNIYLNTNLGLNISYLFSGSVLYTVSIEDEDNNLDREVFALYAHTPNSELQVSAIFGLGLYFPLKYFLLQTNIVYNKSFANVLEGEYQFGNLLVSEPTRGDYKVSGDFIGLSATFYFKKRKKGKKKFIERVR